MTRRCCISIAFAVVALNMTGHFPRAANEQRSPAEAVNPFMIGAHQQDGPPERNDAIHARMLEAGLGGFRDELSWSLLEETTGTFTHRPNNDHLIRHAAENGLRPLLIFDYSNPNYDGGGPPRTDAGRAAFGRYARELVRRYGKWVREWEVWNEPNSGGFWPPAANPKDYAALLKHTYRAVKDVDPTATVGGMVISGMDFGFVEAVLKEGAARSFDFAGVHPYRYPRIPEDTPALDEELRQMQSLLKRYGASTRLWITEMGYPSHTGPSGVSETRQAEMLARSYLLGLSVPGVERFYWYDFLNDGPDRSYNEHNFGVVTTELAPKPAYIALGALTKTIGTKPPLQRLRGRTREDYAIAWGSQSQGYAIAVWSAGAPATFVFDSPSGEADVCDLTTTSLVRMKGPRLAVPAVGLPHIILLRSLPGKSRFIDPALRLIPAETVPGEDTSATLQVNPAFTDWLSPAGRNAWPEGLHMELSDSEARSVRIHAVQPDREGGITLASDSVPVTVSVRGDAAMETHACPAKIRSSDGSIVTLAQVSVRALPPVTALARSIAGSTAPLVEVEVHSNSNVIQRGTLTIVTRAETDDANTTVVRELQLSPRSTAVFEFPYPKAARADEPVDVSVFAGPSKSANRLFSRPLDCVVVPRAPRKLRADGRLKDWSGARPAVLMKPIPSPKEPSLFEPPGSAKAAETTLAQTSLTPENAFAVIWMAYDSANLHIAAEVRDDIHRQTKAPALLWAEDSFQIAFDPTPGAPSPHGIFEFGVGGRQKGRNLHSTLWAYYTPTGAGRGLRHEPVAVTRADGITRYEVALPWKSLGIKSPRPGDTFGLSLLVNDSDKPDQRDWYEWFSGIATDKKPGQYGTITLGR